MLNDKFPDASVTSAWPLVPSEVGILKEVPPDVKIRFELSELIESSGAAAGPSVSVPVIWKFVEGLVSNLLSLIS